MPLNTQIIRDGQSLSLQWGDFHIAAMALASGFDAGMEPLSDPTKIYEIDPRRFDCYPDAPFPITRGMSFHLASYPALAKTPLNAGEYTLTSKHQFIDIMDGEILTLLPGDILRAWRDW
jgi:hypothetical protein